MNIEVSVHETPIQAVARSLCRSAALRALQQGDSGFDLQAYVEAHWTSWITDARDAIIAYRIATRV